MAPADRSRPFSRIREEFERLLEASTDERAGELDRLGREDGKLAREVAALLAADAAASPLLDGSFDRFLGPLGENDGDAPARRPRRPRDGPD